MQPIQGLHHITAVSSNPQASINFYHHLLGQRLVKRTVNFDDPSTYHFYFGDKIGTPGTIMTFFPWRHMRPGVRGNGETGAVGYTIPINAIDYWRNRLRQAGVMVGELQTRFGAAVLPFQDSDGMTLELIAEESQPTITIWEEGPVPAERALRGFHGVTLWLDEVEATAQLLTAELGYTFVGQEGNRFRYRGASNDGGLMVDLLHRPKQPNGRFGAGSVHHIAFRTVDDAEQVAYLQKLRQAGWQVTAVQDRQYFHSIYFRSPGGVLFEVATDAPGFLYDEPIESLGNSLKLPPWLEQQRPQIEATLPKFEMEESSNV